MKVVLQNLCLIALLLLGFIFGCRGYTTDRPPVHPNPNMDTQLKYKPYRESDFFSDSRTMRPLPLGVVARGNLKEDEHFYQGKLGGKLANEYPPSVSLTREFLERGKERFGIYCAPCHSQVGDGNGLVGKRMPIKPTSFHSDYMRALPKGHFFDVISNGIRTMPSYRHQISEADRWAIVSYIEALQLSQKPDGNWLKSPVNQEEKGK